MIEDEQIFESLYYFENNVELEDLDMINKPNQLFPIWLFLFIHCIGGYYI